MFYFLSWFISDNDCIRTRQRRQSQNIHEAMSTWRRQSVWNSLKSRGTKCRTLTVVIRLQTQQQHSWLVSVYLSSSTNIAASLSLSCSSNLPSHHLICQSTTHSITEHTYLTFWLRVWPSPTVTRLASLTTSWTGCQRLLHVRLSFILFYRLNNKQTLNGQSGLYLSGDQ